VGLAAATGRLQPIGWRHATGKRQHRYSARVEVEAQDSRVRYSSRPGLLTERAL
jgi:hypothetical protein